MRVLSKVCQEFQNGIDNLRLVENLLPLAEAAAAAENPDLSGRATTLFDEWLPLVPGLSLASTASTVRRLCKLGRHDAALEAVEELESLGKRWDGGLDPWLPELAGKLRQQIAVARGEPGNG